jgi:hypothetical protein
VFLLKIADAASVSRLSFTELDYWVDRGIARGLLKTA